MPTDFPESVTTMPEAVVRRGPAGAHDRREGVRGGQHGGEGDGAVPQDPLVRPADAAGPLVRTAADLQLTLFLSVGVATDFLGNRF